MDGAMDGAHPRRHRKSAGTVCVSLRTLSDRATLHNSHLGFLRYCTRGGDMLTAEGAVCGAPFEPCTGTGGDARGTISWESPLFCM
jgi:hypothetical protein